MLASELGLGARELVALVGGGGKSTLLFALARELAGRGARVLVTTTTKMGPDQAGAMPTVCRSVAVPAVDRALDGAGPVMLIAAQHPTKVHGPPPDVVDDLYAKARLDYVLVEADGSRGRPLKVPAAHEPVIPATATLVVVVMGIDAVGRPLADVAHRPAEAAALTGLGPGDLVLADDCALVLGHADGGLRGVPAPARVAVALTKVEAGAAAEAAARITALLAGHARLERVVTIPFL